MKTAQRYGTILGVIFFLVFSLFVIPNLTFSQEGKNLDRACGKGICLRLVQYKNLEPYDALDARDKLEDQDVGFFIGDPIKGRRRDNAHQRSEVGFEDPETKRFIHFSGDYPSKMVQYIIATVPDVVTEVHWILNTFREGSNVKQNRERLGDIIAYPKGSRFINRNTIVTPIIKEAIRVENPYYLKYSDCVCRHLRKYEKKVLGNCSEDYYREFFSELKDNQIWIGITSSQAGGMTDITAYAPEIKDARENTVYASIRWIPQPAPKAIDDLKYDISLDVVEAKEITDPYFSEDISFNLDYELKIENTGYVDIPIKYISITRKCTFGEGKPWAKLVEIPGGYKVISPQKYITIPIEVTDVSLGMAKPKEFIPFQIEVEVTLPKGVCSERYDVATYYASEGTGIIYEEEIKPSGLYVKLQKNKRLFCSNTGQGPVVGVQIKNLETGATEDVGIIPQMTGQESGTEISKKGLYNYAEVGYKVKYLVEGEWVIKKFKGLKFGRKK